MTLALGTLAAALVALAAVGVGPAEAKKKQAKGGAAKIVFASNRTTGKGVDNPEGDYDIFVTDPKGTKPKQLTKNAVDDDAPVLSPDGKKVAYESVEAQSSNLEGDYEVYLMNALDGSGKKNLFGGGATTSPSTGAGRRRRRSAATVADPPSAERSRG